MRIALLALLGACTPTAVPESETSTSTQRLGDLQYVAPVAGWTHHDTKEISRWVSRWSPEENANKESISIIRVAARPTVKRASSGELEEMLRDAQQSLPNPAVLVPTMAETKQHLREVEVVADFVPSGLKDSYHRVHAMILDGDVLIHVLYTARRPDPSLTAFHQVVDTIRRGEGSKS